MPSRIAMLLTDADPIVRESALKIAGYFGYPDCLARVLACCRDNNETVRRTAIEQLPFFEDASVFDALVHAIEHDGPSVRAAAASALARVEHPSRTGVLLRALGDGDPWVRFVTLRTLGAIGATEAVPLCWRPSNRIRRHMCAWRRLKYSVGSVRRSARCAPAAHRITQS
jgi:HEAT repeat protein